MVANSDGKNERGDGVEGLGFGEMWAGLERRTGLPGGKEGIGNGVEGDEGVLGNFRNRDLKGWAEWRVHSVI